MRVALYARVSTRDKDQNPENQLVLLRREAEHAGDSIISNIKEYIDEESVGKASRKQFQQLMQDAGKRQFDLMHVFALDCFRSEGIEAVFEHTARLDQWLVARATFLIGAAAGVGAARFAAGQLVSEAQREAPAVVAVHPVGVDVLVAQ